MFFFFVDFLTAAEIYRQLLFKGYTDATEYLGNSPLNRYLYRSFINILPKHEISVPIVTIFNEIYFQCARINLDGTPGVDIKQRYIDEETKFTKSEVATQLIFSIIMALLKSKRKLTFHEECFLIKLTPYVKECEFNTLVNIMFYDFSQLGIYAPDEFPIMKSQFCDIPYIGLGYNKLIEEYVNKRSWRKSDYKNKAEKDEFEKFDNNATAWRFLTNNYSHYTVEKYLRLFKDIRERKNIIELLMAFCEWEGNHKAKSYLTQLGTDMELGQFSIDDKDQLLVDNNTGVTPEEYDEYHRNLALDRAVADKQRKKYEQLQRDCEQLRQQLEEQKKSHQLALDRLNAKYQAEITEIKKKQQNNREKPDYKPQTGVAQLSAGNNIFTIEEMVTEVRDRFEMISAKEFCSMYYRLSAKHGYWDEKMCKLVDDIIPAIKERDARHQTINFESELHQVNINTQVENKYTGK